jgi:DNA-binding response OmpR family regulator
MVVLVIDDDFRIAYFFAESIKRQGYEVHVAHDGGTGLIKTVNLKPDLVILDLLMPGTSGQQYLEAKRDTAQKDVPVIVLSAYSDTFKPETQDVVRILVKPVKILDLIEEVSKVLGGQP